jgi:alpha-glucosidase
MEFASIFQVPTVGTDVCGFNFPTTETLCARWAVLGAFYPFYRNHADIASPFQEFYRWPLVADAAREAIKRRMQLLDYFYTEFHYQTVDGTPTTILPLFFLYPNDTTTLDIDLQFFYGSALLVSPVTDENSTSVTFYLPQDTFYDFFTGAPVHGQGASVTRTNVSYTEIPVHIRGGSILPMRIDGANTTAQLRDLDFELVVAPDATGHASGRLYLDDGESIAPTATSEISFAYDAGARHIIVGGTFGYRTRARIVRVTVLGDTNSSATAITTDPGTSRRGAVIDVNEPLTGGFTVNV